MLKLVRDLIHQECHGNAPLEMWDEVLSPHCRLRTILGQKIGLDCFKQSQLDLFGAFPDFKTEIQSLNAFGNAVCCEVKFIASHLNYYVDKCLGTSGVLIRSDFSQKFSALKPQGKKIVQNGEIIFVFEANKISHFLIQEDPTTMYQQLNLNVSTEKAQKNLVLKREYTFLIEKVRKCLCYSLSPKECLCLAFALSGFSSKHSGELLGNSYRTIEGHLQQVYWKLGCMGKKQCLEMMITKKLLLLMQEICRLALVQEHFHGKN